MTRVLVNTVISFLTNIPVLLFVIPMIHGLSFTGSFWSAVGLSFILEVACLVALLTVILIAGALGLFSDEANGLLTFVALTAIDFICDVAIVRAANGHLGLHVSSLGAAVVAVLVMAGVSSLVLRHVDA